MNITPLHFWTFVLLNFFIIIIQTKEKHTDINGIGRVIKLKMLKSYIWFIKKIILEW